MTVEAVWDESGILTHYIGSILEIPLDPRDGGFMFFENGRLVGAVRVYDIRGDLDNRHAAIMGASTSPRWFTKTTIKAVASMIFGTPPYGLGFKRLNSFINADNPRSLTITERIGFKVEGVMRKAGPGRQDITVLGMLKEECPWFQEDDEALAGDNNPGKSEMTETPDG
jgi:RimJ/RimL family protein N-acetyltransferase